MVRAPDAGAPGGRTRVQARRGGPRTGGLASGSRAVGRTGGVDRARAAGRVAGSTAGMRTRTAVPGYRAIGARGSHSERIEGSMTQRAGGEGCRAPCGGDPSAGRLDPSHEAGTAIGQAPRCAGPAMIGHGADGSQRGDASSGSTGPPHCASAASGASVHRSGHERGAGAEANRVATTRGSDSQRDPGGRRIVPRASARSRPAVFASGQIPAAAVHPGTVSAYRALRSPLDFSQFTNRTPPGDSNAGVLGGGVT